jgi:uncharacterized membrane protein YGL010W
VGFWVNFTGFIQPTTPNSAMEILQQQHEIDLVIYRDSHQEFCNRMLHHIFIPVETAGFFALANKILQHVFRNTKYNIIIKILPTACCWTMGFLSLILSPDVVGLLALLFHVVAIPWVMDQPLRYQILLTIVAWSIQICIGHWVLERNQPTLQQGTASTLSMLTSIVIAWKS